MVVGDVTGMIQTTLIMVWIFLSTTFFGSLIILVTLLGATPDTAHKIASLWGRTILFAARIKVAVKGLHHLDPTRPHIYMSNHQSNFDIPVIIAFLAVQFRWLAKAELFRIPLFGHAMRRVGYISIDRSDLKTAIKSLKHAARSIRSGASVMIFPEGTRSLDGNIRPFKKGGFVMAIEAGVPIVPLIIHGTRAIMPKDKLRIRPGTVVLEILAPVATSAYTRKTKDDLLRRVNTLICDAFEKGRMER